MILKRGNTYHVKFTWQGRAVWRSAHTSTLKVARQVEARLRSELALGHVGILEAQRVPTFGEFVRERIEPKALLAADDVLPRQKRFRWLQRSLKPLGASELGKLELNRITTEHVLNYADARSAKGRSIGTVNRELRALRRCLRLAVEWGVLEKAPKISMAGKEPGRERVVTDAELSRYLRYATPLLADVANILNETGLRPDELHRLDWEDINFAAGRYGTLRVRFGKTEAARRTLPLTAKVRCILAARHVAAESPSSGWIFPSDESESGHINHSTLRKPHDKALRLSKVPEFVLYSLRHSFATRIAPLVDAWTLCKIMGWSSLSVAMRYIHPSEDRVLAAFESHGQTAIPESTNGSNSGSSRLIVGEQPMLELSGSTKAAIA